MFRCVLLNPSQITATLVLPALTEDTMPRTGEDGWDLVFTLTSTDPDSDMWHSINERHWALQRPGVDHVHRMLFGDENLADQVSRLDTVRLLLASVGIVLGVATQHDDSHCQGLDFEACQSDERDEQNPGGQWAITWDVDECVHWFGRHIRAVCNEAEGSKMPCTRMSVSTQAHSCLEAHAKPSL